MLKQAVQWLGVGQATCPVSHFHVNDVTCHKGPPPPGAQSGPHVHVNNANCYPLQAGVALPPGACETPHWHSGDPTFRPATKQGGCSNCGQKTAPTGY